MTSPKETSPKGGVKRTPQQRQFDFTVISKRHLQGIPAYKIAEELARGRSYTLTSRTINNDIKAVKKIWRESAQIDISEAIAKELAHIDLIELTAWEGWNRSLENKKTSISKEIQGGAKNQLEATLTQVDQSGDPRFLQVMDRCGKNRRELLGLDAAVNIDLTTGGEKLIITEVAYVAAEVMDVKE